MDQRTLSYQADGLEMRGQLFFEPAVAPRAAVLVFPEAFGLGENALRHAKPGPRQCQESRLRLHALDAMTGKPHVSTIRPV